MQPDTPAEIHSRHALVLKASLLALWAFVSFVCCWFARDLQFIVAGWPFSYWLGAQGAVLVFIGIVAVYAWAMNRLEAAEQGGLAGKDRDRAGDA